MKEPTQTILLQDKTKVGTLTLGRKDSIVFVNNKGTSYDGISFHNDFDKRSLIPSRNYVEMPSGHCVLYNATAAVHPTLKYPDGERIAEGDLVNSYNYGDGEIIYEEGKWGIAYKNRTNELSSYQLPLTKTGSKWAE